MVLLSFPQSSSFLSVTVPKAALSIADFGTENHVDLVQRAALRPTAPRNKKLSPKQYNKYNVSEMQHLKKNIFLGNLTWESTLKRSINHSSHSAPSVINETQTH